MRGVVTGVMVGTLLASAIALADPGFDLERAKDLYKSAEAAMTDARYSDAIRDYGAAYEITKDAVLFYKIGAANERLGKCEVALIYYRQYLKEGTPSEQFVKTTTDRIVACGGAAPDRGSGAVVTPNTSPIEPNPYGSVGAIDPTPTTPPAAGSKSATPEAPPKLGKNRGPWLLIGGSIAFVTIGSVLAYSANAAERDVEDLYVGLAGTPPVFDARTRQRYEDAIEEGERYQTLSLVSFGIAGAMAAGAALWFVLDREAPVKVAPAASPSGAGVQATIRF